MPPYSLLGRKWNQEENPEVPSLFINIGPSKYTEKMCRWLILNIGLTPAPANTHRAAIAGTCSCLPSLLMLMLGANRAVLLTGERGWGKTTLYKSLLSFYKPHIILPASPRLSSRDLLAALNNIRLWKNCKDTLGPIPKAFNFCLYSGIYQWQFPRYNSHSPGFPLRTPRKKKAVMKTCGGGV